MEKRYCSATVFGPRVHSWGCTRTGVVKRDGKWYCRQHDPEAVKAKHAKADDQWAAKRESDDAVCAEGERIAKALGVDAQTHYSTSGPYSKHGPTRNLVISFDDCLKLVEQMRDAKRAVAPSASEA